jgi:hypothetical protein
VWEWEMEVSLLMHTPRRMCESSGQVCCCC